MTITANDFYRTYYPHVCRTSNEWLDFAEAYAKYLRGLEDYTQETNDPYKIAAMVLQQLVKPRTRG